MQKENTIKGSNKKNKAIEYIIQAGEMPIVGGKVKPNSDKGEIRFHINDGLLNFEWKNSDKNITYEPIVIFEGEWEWVKVNTQKGRVYKLQSKSFPDKQFYYWMQNPNKTDDEINETIINNILNTGRLEINENPSEIEDLGVDSVIKREETQIEIGNTTTNTTKNTDFIKNFSNSLAFAKRMFNIILIKLEKYPSLNKILTKNNIYKILNDEKTSQELIKLLPENQQTNGHLIDNISSPQFQQAMESLSNALNSENLPYILQSFGLNTQKRMSSSPNGVESFVMSIIEKFKKDQNNQEK